MLIYANQRNALIFCCLSMHTFSYSPYPIYPPFIHVYIETQFYIPLPSRWRSWNLSTASVKLLSSFCQASVKLLSSFCQASAKLLPSFCQASSRKEEKVFAETAFRRSRTFSRTMNPNTKEPKINFCPN